MITAEDLAGHYLKDPGIIHDDFQASTCNCQVQFVAAPPQSYNANSEGKICAGCGGSSFIRTGACMTCADCATSDGCG